jgi:uncharacterized membrane protein YbhN (UPF0104 family)
MRAQTRSWLGPLAGVLLLLATLYYVDQSALRTRLSQLRAAPILLGAALIFPQLYWLASRWRLTLRQLGIELSQRRALREYALSILLNQLLPFGVAGDAVRVARHAHARPRHFTRRSATSARADSWDREEAARTAGASPAAASSERSPPGPAQRTRLVALRTEPCDAPRTGFASAQGPGLSGALHGVVLDRFMGQLVVIAWALATLPLWFGAAGFGACAFGFALLWLAAAAVRRRPALGALQQRSAAMRALLRLSLALRELLASPRYLASQFLLSSLLVISLAAQLYCALSALGLQLSAAQAAQVFPLMLLSMSVPLSFAGFGPRETVTAELYSLLKLSAADGAAFAIAFGAIQVCTSLPCLLLVLCLPAEQAP